MSAYDTEPETPLETRGRERSGLHPVNVAHLVMGTAFVGLAIVWLLVAEDVVELDRSGWVLAIPWLVAGAAGLVATVLSGWRRAP